MLTNIPVNLSVDNRACQDEQASISDLEGISDVKFWQGVSGAVSAGLRAFLAARVLRAVGRASKGRQQRSLRR